MRNEIVARIEILLEADAGTLSEATLLQDIASWDSLAAVGFIAMIDENFGITPPPKKIAASKTVGDLVNLACADPAGQ